MEQEPVIVNSVISLVFAVFGTWLVAHGITENVAEAVLAAAIGIGVAVWRIIVARGKVTPVATPAPPAAPPEG